jgi:hypothetical protein
MMAHFLTRTFMYLFDGLGSKENNTLGVLRRPESAESARDGLCNEAIHRRVDKINKQK